MSKVLHDAALEGDIKAATTILQSQHDWKAAQTVSQQVISSRALLNLVLRYRTNSFTAGNPFAWVSKFIKYLICNPFHFNIASKIHRYCNINQ
jgi:hypothetical protein